MASEMAILETAEFGTLSIRVLMTEGGMPEIVVSASEPSPEFMLTFVDVDGYGYPTTIDEVK